MGELEDLRREEQRLDAQEEARRDMARHQQEKDKLKRNIWFKKNPSARRVVKVVKVAGSVAKQSTLGVGMILGSVYKKAKPVLQKYANEGRAPKSRRVVRVKKVKRKAPKKKRKVRVKKIRKKKRVVKVIRSAPRSNLPNFNDFFN